MTCFRRAAYVLFGVRHCELCLIRVWRQKHWNANPGQFATPIDHEGEVCECTATTAAPGTPPA